MFELDVQVHADITPVAFVAVMVRTLVGFVDFAGSPPLLLLMSLGQHLAALLEKFFDVADHRCKLLVLQGELLRLENYHLVDEVGLPKLFVVADVLIVLRVFRATVAQLLRTVVLVNPVALHLHIVQQF